MTLKNKENKREFPFNEHKNEKRHKQSSMMSFFGLNNFNQTIMTKFNKQVWIQGLTEQQRELLKLEIECLHESWLSLKSFLKQEKKSHTIFPPDEDKDIYSWSHYTPLNTVKVVILGQDPYHNYNQAHGLCFSVRPPTPPPPSLKNIFIALQNDYPSFNIPKDGLLTPWAKRGVLLLNSSLTEKNHLVLKSVHPSPLSASKGFFNCGHFKKANEWLSKKYGEDGIIDWNCLYTEQTTNSSKTLTSILNDHTNLKTGLSETYLDSESKEVRQDTITTPSLSRDELTTIESSITLEELDNSLSSDDTKSDKE
ncbi:hypothetical protein PCK2_000846 [Pneumocystis canis]|nr:hypothetical protein PCK2_000846 [Pneumocystis canis]